MDLQFPADDYTEQLIRMSLMEDLGSGDATTSITVNDGQVIRAEISAREPGVVAGLPLLDILFEQMNTQVNIETIAPDGTPVQVGDVVAVLEGPAASILTGERILLNFMQNLSGIASLTSLYVAQVKGTHCKVLDTRKTLPGYRHLAKYAVRCGGGHNHRMGLYDRIMLKDNHWAAAGNRVADLVAAGRQQYPKLAIEVEVDTIDQLNQVLKLNVEWIMLDNFSFSETQQAVQLRNEAQSNSMLESSGNVTLETIGGYSQAGVDAASVGRLTHSIQALDLGLDMNS
ncbi:MAG: carboxylating nicotinate-nucleotide diphosphorylase [bacterium]|nr:carboxylating nicotinate-nucleotide diphosphorylase [bacterium]